MLEATSSSLISFFVVACLLAFFWPFFKNVVAKQISIANLRPTLPAFFALIGGFGLFFLLMHFLHFQIGEYFVDFALGAFLVYIFGAINMPQRLAGVAFLALTVALSAKPVHLGGEALICLAAGALIWKLLENLYVEKSRSIGDILPALVYIGGLNFLAGAADEPQIKQGMLLASLAVVLIFRLLETPFLDDDKVYLKRLMLATTAGLFYLVVLTKLLLVPAHFDRYALLFGLGVFVSYLLQSAKQRTKTVYGYFYLLVLIGAATVFAWRLFGAFGLILLAVAALVGRSEETSEFVGLFWISRVFLQVFIIGFVANVTGINTTHPYVGAALYGGMLFIFLVSIMIRDFYNKRIFISLLALSVSSIPFLLNYFLHAEACAAFLQAALVAAILLSILAPCLYRQEIEAEASLLLVPSCLICLAIIGGEFLPLGNEAPLATKLTVMSYAFSAFLVLSILPWKLFGKSAGKAVDVSGNS